MVDLIPDQIRSKGKAELSWLRTISDTSRNCVADLVFVHGLGADPHTAWCYDAEKPKDSWPSWLADDVPGVAVHCLGYDAAPTAWLGSSMPLIDRATNVLTRFEAEGIGRRPTVFVCHSLGGLLIKQTLRSALDMGEPAWRPLINNTRGILFLATPHTGTSLATFIKYLGVIGTVLRFTVSVRELEANTPTLRNLNLWYRQNSKQLGIETLCLFETQDSRGVRVVDESSADSGLGVPRPIDADHMTICKPASRKDLVYEITRNFVTRLADPPVPH